jgi:hypothetical protein
VCVSVCVCVCVCVCVSVPCRCVYVCVCVGVSGIKERRNTRASNSGCKVEYMVEFDDARHFSFWEWVYADKLSGCDDLIRALDRKVEVHVEEVESDESEEDEPDSEVEIEESEEDEGDAPLDNVVKIEGTPHSFCFEPHNALSQTQQRATSAPLALWTRESWAQAVEVVVTWSTK